MPVVLQCLITAGVNMMDTIMLTSCGEIQLSASSLANQFISLFQIICNGIGFGAAVLTSRYWGAKDAPSIRKATTIMLRFALIASLLFTLLSFFAPAFIMRIYTPDTPIVTEGVRYLKISAFTFVLFGLSQTITCVMRSVRDRKSVV